MQSNRLRFSYVRSGSLVLIAKAIEERLFLTVTALIRRSEQRKEENVVRQKQKKKVPFFYASLFVLRRELSLNKQGKGEER